MRSIYSKKFNWIRTPSAWEDTKAWRERRRAMREHFENQTLEVANSIGNAVANQIDQSVTIAAQVANDRVQKEAKAKQEAFVAALQGTNVNKFA